MDPNREYATSYTTHYQQAFLKYVADEYCDNHRRLPVNKRKNVPSTIHVPSAMASAFYQLTIDPYDSSSDDEEYSRPTNLSETTPRQSDRAACWLTAASLHSNSPPEAPKN